ncbi:MAG: hypothetical protein JST54_26145, partial [Deltaproteobacteria bacterium]|nr:hypothetical protein [Deltaproteobacteria bacterium]
VDVLLVDVLLVDVLLVDVPELPIVVDVAPMVPVELAAVPVLAPLPPRPAVFPEPAVDRDVPLAPADPPFSGATKHAESVHAISNPEPMRPAIHALREHAAMAIRPPP